MRKYLIAAAMLIVCTTGIYAGLRYRKDVYLPEKELQEDYERLTEEIDNIRPDIHFENEKQASDENNSPLEKAENYNSDIVGWIKIPETNIDYPIVQSDDNDYYLHHALDGSDNQLGVPFLDCRCLPDFSGFTSIVYGHHFSGMRMFAQIFSFKERSFLEQHNIGYLIANDEVKKISFFAYLNIKSNSPIYHTVFLTENEREDYLKTLFSEAAFTENYEKEDLVDKHLLLLSTCTYEFEDARGVLVGVIEDS